MFERVKAMHSSSCPAVDGSPYSVAVVSYLGKLVHVRVAHTRG